MPSTINADNGVSSGSAGLKSAADSSGVLSLQTNGTTAVTVDTSQNVGVGTSSPAYKLDVAATTAVVQMDSSSGAAGAAGTRYKASNRTWVSGVNLIDGTGAYTVYDVTASAERMRIDSSGNLGLGVTPSASWQSQRRVMQVGGNIALWGQSSGAGSLFLSNNTYYDGTNFRYLNTSGAGYYAQATDGSHTWNSAPSGTAGNTISFTQAMTLDANGGLLVGTTTNNGRISSLASGSGTAGYFSSSGSTITLVVADSGVNGAGIALYGNGATTPNKYIRAQAGSLQFINNAYSQVIALFADAGVYNTAVGGTNRVMYVDSGNTIGYLSSVRASKTNIAPMPATDWLLQLQPKTFNYRKKDVDGKYIDEADGGIQYGLIAEEVEQVKPDLCFYDEVDGKQELRGIHYEKLVVPMLKAIQELKAEVDSLKSQLAAKG